MTSVGVRKGDLAFREVARRLEGAGVAWAVFAGAASAYGANRPLTDVDILVPMVEGGRVAALFPHAILVCQEDGAVRGVQANKRRNRDEHISGT